MAKAKAIFIPGTNMTFQSASAAAKVLGINAGNIYKVLNGQRKTAGGYSFGYESNKTIYIPQTGQTFSNPRAAARSVGVKPGRVYDVLSGNVRSKSKPKYDFVYADTTKINAASATSNSVPNRKKSRKENKQQQIQQNRQRKKEKFAQQKRKIETRIQERAEASIRRQQRDEERQRRRILRPATQKYEKSKKQLQSYLEKVNAKLKEYNDLHKYFVNYNPSAPDVLGLQMAIGYTEDGYFNTTLSKFSVVYDDTASIQEIESALIETAERMERLKKVLEDATNKANGRFWDINVAKGNRSALALEFNITESQMDNYADPIWDMLDVLQEANHHEELGSELVYNAVSDAMQGNIPDWKLAEFLENISAYMDGDSIQDIDEIFMILNGYHAPGSGIWDDEGWVM